MSASGRMTNRSCRADGRDPRQQGLKHPFPRLYRHRDHRRWARSTTTRIETAASHRAPGTAPGADGRDPRQQGLKRDIGFLLGAFSLQADGRDPRQQGLKQNATPTSVTFSGCRWARSTTTRIETGRLYGLQLHRHRADGRDPRQQGLKLGAVRRASRPQHQADGRDPRQQGLKHQCPHLGLGEVIRPMGEIHDNKD